MSATDKPIVPEEYEKPAREGFYCPGCGKTSTYQRECVGPKDKGHPAIEMVPAAELDGDPADFTPAPDTDKLR